MIERVVLATANVGKVREFEDLFQDSRIIKTFISLKNLGNPPEVIEDGNTFRENALKKARGISAYSGEVSLADDSGLQVEVLNGRPGIYSSRYSGEDATDESNIEKLLGELKDKLNRNARFVCYLALVYPTGEEIVVSGACDGVILHEPRGKGGFGYDPVFYLSHIGKTMAEMSYRQKNEISHRSHAVYSLIDELRKKF